MCSCKDPEIAFLVRSFDHLDPEERARLESHLEGCQACRKKVRFFQALSAVMEDMQGKMGSSDHPSPEELLAAQGQEREGVSDNRLDEVRSHLERCPECREALSFLDRSEKESGHFQAASEMSADPRIKASAARIRSVFFDRDEETSRRPDDLECAVPAHQGSGFVKERIPGGKDEPWYILAFLFLLRWRVSALVPICLAVILFGVLLFSFPESTPFSPESRPTWLSVGNRVEYFVPLHTRGTDPASSPCRVKPGQVLEITLPKVPSTGFPICLVLDGMGDTRSDESLSFRLKEGFPHLAVVVPEIPPGEYQARVLGGESRKEIHTFPLIINE